MRIAEIAARVNTRELARKLIPDKLAQERTSYDVYWCPLHKDTDPSFRVYDDHYYCYGCNAHGDSADLGLRIGGLKASDLLQYAGVYHPPTPQPKPTPKAQEDYTTLALKWHRSLKASVYWDYLLSRGINADILIEQKVGLAAYPWPYKDKNGHQIRTYPIRYTIPNWRGGKAISIKLRRDEGFIQCQLPYIQHLIEKARRDFSEPVTDAFLINLIYGDKYICKGSMNIYGLEIAQQALPYVVINEGKELDCMALWSLGIPAIGIPQKQNLVTASMIKPEQVYIVPDNDEAGRKKAAWLQQQIPHATILSLPNHVKDFGELKIHERIAWLHEHNLKPVTFDRPIYQPDR